MARHIRSRILPRTTDMIRVPIGIIVIHTRMVSKSRVVMRMVPS